ncbi:MAG: primosomal protein N' [Caldilineaceae bacterium]
MGAAALVRLSSAQTRAADADPYQGCKRTHYHIPTELLGKVEAGHLVWAPFGHQEVQGVVVRLSHSAPVETKPLLRLARPEPVLTPAQLSLAAWIADYYLASFVNAIKLFLPPGLLTRTKKDGSQTQARAKRELQIELAADAAAIAARLPTLGRDSAQATVLAWLIAQGAAPIATRALMDACELRSNNAIRALLTKGILADAQPPASASTPGQWVRLALEPAAARQALLELRGADKFALLLTALQEADAPLWKSELYQRADADLNMLRTLQKAGLIRLSERVRFRDPLAGQTYRHTTPPPLTSDQARAWQTIAEQAFGGAAHAPQQAGSKFLLHGVTGSGKTEIYLRTIEQTLQQGRQAIVLVPEIALTPQTVARFAGRFPDRVTVIHSELSQGERYDVWRAVRDGEYDVVIGPRSALFAPLPRPGLIILDEEHETSYKQNAEAWGSHTVFYDARLVAQQLAALTNSVLIFGSATPSLEAYFDVVGDGEQPAIPSQNGWTLLEMPRRVLGHRATPANSVLTVDAADDAIYAELPPVELVDMRQELRAGNRSIFSRLLQSELHATLDANEQAILFLNRRGARTFVMCRDCGHVQSCPRCDTPLTYHENASVLVCHHCNQRAEIPQICGECNSKRIKYFGSGTQRVEEIVGEIAPRARLLRWDADTTGTKGSHEAILRRFANREADVLVGTQMIAKGLDLPMVTLVGVISADTGLYLPDFRSAERTFQLLTQVAGRAGRSERGGRVVIQTYTPEHYAIQAAAQHDYHAFYAREITFRREHSYPPTMRLLRLVYWDKKLEKAQQAAEEMANLLRYRVQSLGPIAAHTDVAGPAPAFFARFRGYYRWQVLARGPDPAALLRGQPIPFGWRVDVDPMSML